MLNAVILISCIIGGSVMLITGISLLIEWYTRINQWKTMPRLREIAGSLLDGMLGATGTAIGSLVLGLIILGRYEI